MIEFMHKLRKAAIEISGKQNVIVRLDCDDETGDGVLTLRIFNVLGAGRIFTGTLYQSDVDDPEKALGGTLAFIKTLREQGGSS